MGGKMSMRFFFVFLELYLNTPFMFCIIKVFSLFVFLFLLFFLNVKLPF